MQIAFDLGNTVDDVLAISDAFGDSSEIVECLITPPRVLSPQEVGALRDRAIEDGLARLLEGES